MTSQKYKSMEDTTSVNMDDRTVFIVGKTGNGKSSVGNAILGRQEFPVSSSMASTTTTVHQDVGNRGGERIRVIDTPDPVNLDLSDTAINAEVARWKSQATGRFAILLAVRCDVRYTAEEYDIYKKIKAAWGDKSFRDHLVVAFTFGDRQDRDLAEELKTVCWELRSVLTDAGNRYVVFNNRAYESEHQVRQLLKVLDYMEKQPPPVTSTSYFLLLLLVGGGVIIVIAVWFGVPWHSEMLKSGTFIIVVVVASFGVFVVIYNFREKLVLIFFWRGNHMKPRAHAYSYREGVLE